MIAISTIYRAPPDSSLLTLGRTLPSLLDEACDRHPNDKAFNQWQKRRWEPLSTLAFRKAAEEFALGVLSLGLQQGDRVALVMHNDIPFCITDMGCLLAGLVNVPIDLTQTIENILYILNHTEAKVLVISNLDLLYQVSPYLASVPSLCSVIVAEVDKDWEEVKQGLTRRRDDTVTEPFPNSETSEAIFCSSDVCLHIPQLLSDGYLEEVCPASVVPRCIQLLPLEEIRKRGQDQWSMERVTQLRDAITPKDLATILYIASETKQPRGVMLSHENISADVLAAFGSHPSVKTGAEEVALLFLPLTHIFARVFLYGHLNYGHSVYFSNANHLVRHLKLVNPTILITVPRLLEKIYERILDQGKRLSKFDRAVFHWAVKLAHRYELGQPQTKLFALQLKLADRLVFGKWRSVFGDRMKALICGGATLRAELANFFSAANVPVLQGYGLTETSAVLCYNRGAYNRAGTVGVPIAGVEITLADDREILVKAPFVMQGYYRDPQATEHVFDEQGWLHTGDLGEITSDGFLKITGVKKSLFKLATGKYVSPLPLEQELNQSPLVAHAIAVGANHKFCGMLIVPNFDALRTTLEEYGVTTEDESWLEHSCTLALYQTLIDRANCHLPYWSTVRRFKLIDAHFTVENSLLNLDGTINRMQVFKAFADEIASLYENEPENQKHDGDQDGETGRESKNAKHENAKQAVSLSPVVSCPQVPSSSCPIYAKSLTHY